MEKKEMKDIDNKTKILLIYMHNLDKLLEQHSDYFFKRFDYMNKNDWDNVKHIEDVYMKLIDQIIYSLIKIILEGLK